MTTISKQFYPKLALGTFAVIAAASSATATLNYDLRATALNGVPLAPAFAKGNGLALQQNDLITFTVYAQVTGTAGDNQFEGFQSGWFNIL